MSVVAIAIGGSALLGYASSQNSANAAEDASAAQQASAQSGIDEQRRQFDAVQQLLSPYAAAGTQALNGQQNILGLNGNAAQQSAYSAIENSPAYTSLVQQGENGILQNASATGNLRGGNVQSALAQFRPSVLSALIDQQYSRLGGLTSIGQNAAAGVGNAGMSTGNSVSALMQQQGAAQAGASIAGARANALGANSIAGALGQYSALGGFGGASPGGLQGSFSQTSVGGGGFGTGLAYGNQDMGQYF